MRTIGTTAHLGELEQKIFNCPAEVEVGEFDWMQTIRALWVRTQEINSLNVDALQPPELRAQAAEGLEMVRLSAETYLDIALAVGVEVLLHEISMS